MTIYTIAGTSTTHCQGADEHEDAILRLGSYNCGPFPPCFHTRKEAEYFLSRLEWSSGKKVVELELLPQGSDKPIPTHVWTLPETFNGHQANPSDSNCGQL